MVEMTASRPVGIVGKGMVEIKAWWAERAETSTQTIPNP